MLRDYEANACLIQGRLRKPKNAVDSGDLPFSDRAIPGIADELSMHPRGVGTVDHLRILLGRTIGQVQQPPGLIEKCGCQFSMFFRLEQIPHRLSAFSYYDVRCGRSDGSAPH